MKANKTRTNEIIKLYAAHHPHQQFTIDEVYTWAISMGYDFHLESDREKAAKKAIKLAIKKENYTDPQGREVPRYICIVDESDRQLFFWSDITITTPNVMQRGLDLLRQNSVSGLVQAQHIANSYNDNAPVGAETVTVRLGGIEDEVAEQVILRKHRRGKSEDDLDDLI